MSSSYDGFLPVNFTEEVSTIFKSELKEEKSILIIVLCLAIWQSLVSFFVFMQEGQRMHQERNGLRNRQP